MNRRGSPLLLTFLLLAAVPGAGAADWYLSNAGGMDLSYIPSRLAALRNKYALSVDRAPGQFPPALTEYQGRGLRPELRVLYEDGKEARRQWLLRDGAGRIRLAAAGEAAFFEEAPGERRRKALEEAPAEGGAEGEESEEEQKFPRGFIQQYNERGLIIEERRFEGDGTETRTLFSYYGDVLVKAEIFGPPAPAETQEEAAETAAAETAVAVSAGDEVAATESGEPEGEAAPAEPAAEPVPAEPVLLAADEYLYSRAGSLRAINRRLYDRAGEEAPLRTAFPQIKPDFGEKAAFVSPAIAYSPVFVQDGESAPDIAVRYDTDDRGRVLSETHLGEGEQVTGTVENTWAGDRLSRVHSSFGKEDMVTEYEYDSAGARILEKNYRQGVLERTVTVDGDREVEELYINGKAVLRAIWKDGRKISEERVR